MNILNRTKSSSKSPLEDPMTAISANVATNPYYTNGYIYAIFMVILLGMGIEYWAAISEVSGINELLFIMSNALIFLLTYMDRESIKEKNPQKQLFSLFWIVLLPGYLIVRSRFLKQRQYYVVIWLVILGLSILLSQYIDYLFTDESLEINDSLEFYY
ncbi:hypothetical protein [Ignatzschineria sp. LJL83]